jgi:hypothetical protein
MQGSLKLNRDAPRLIALARGVVDDQSEIRHRFAKPGGVSDTLE